jgi:hypothetical protein
VEASLDGLPAFVAEQEVGKRVELLHPQYAAEAADHQGSRQAFVRGHDVDDSRERDHGRGPWHTAAGAVECFRQPVTMPGSDQWHAAVHVDTPE